MIVEIIVIIGLFIVGFYIYYKFVFLNLKPKCLHEHK